MGDITKGTHLGQTVIYTDHTGRESAAVVIMTPDMFDPEKAPFGAEAPGETAVSLKITTSGGLSYTRHGIHQEGSDAHQALVQGKAAFDAALVSDEADLAATGVLGNPDDDPLDENDSTSLLPPPAPVKVRSWRFRDAS